MSEPSWWLQPVDWRTTWRREDLTDGQQASCWNFGERVHVFRVFQLLSDSSSALYLCSCCSAPPPTNCLTVGPETVALILNIRLKTSSFILLVCSWRYVGHSSASLQIGHLLPVTEHYLRLFLSPLLQVALESFHGLQCNVGSFVCWQKGQL